MFLFYGRHPGAGRGLADRVEGVRTVGYTSGSGRRYGETHAAKTTEYPEHLLNEAEPDNGGEKNE